jgi:glycosyltransferase involved in cell wall biosynthesis
VRKKITIVSHYASSISNFRGPLLKALKIAGADVQVLAPDWQADSLRYTQSLGIQVGHFNLSRVGLNLFEDLHTVYDLYKIFKTSKPDVVFTYAAKTNVWGTLAATLAGVPHRVAMVEGLGYLFTEGVKGRSAKQRVLAKLLAVLYRIAFKLAHRVVTLNPDDAADLQRLCSLSAERTILLGGIGVPLSEWPFCPPHTDPISFTMIARLLREKGIFEYLQAARLVKQRYPSVRFYLLGGFDENPGALRQADIQPWLDDGTVEWPGQVSVKPWLARTSVFVLPSYREGVPRSTQEAMAMGRPVITTNVPGCRETVIDGVNGFMVPPCDASAIASAMLKFVHSSSLVVKMGTESRILAERRFDVDEINIKLMKALEIVT